MTNKDEAIDYLSGLFDELSVMGVLTDEELENVELALSILSRRD